MFSRFLLMQNMCSCPQTGRCACTPGTGGDPQDRCFPQIASLCNCRQIELDSQQPAALANQQDSFGTYFLFGVRSASLCYLSLTLFPVERWVPGLPAPVRAAVPLPAGRQLAHLQRGGQQGRRHPEPGRPLHVPLQIQDGLGVRRHQPARLAVELRLLGQHGLLRRPVQRHQVRPEGHLHAAGQRGQLQL